MNDRCKVFMSNESHIYSLSEVPTALDYKSSCLYHLRICTIIFALLEKDPHSYFAFSVFKEYLHQQTIL